MAPTLTTEVVPGPVPVVRASGELDLSTAARLCRTIQTATAGPRPRLTIDATALTFCDSTGLRALVGAVREVDIQGGRATVVVSPDGMLDRVLQITGLDEFLQVSRRHSATLRTATRSVSGCSASGPRWWTTSTYARKCIRCWKS